MLAASAAAMIPPARDWSRLIAWRRVRFVLILALPFSLMNSATSATTPTWIWFIRVAITGLLAMLMFGVFEQWPATLPKRLARWVLQLIGLVVAVPIGAALAYWVTTGELAFWNEPLRLTGWRHIFFQGILFGPWIALGAMVRQREALAREQALAFALERSQFERQALDARLKLMQAQVQPHFLFNTLANVRALVRTGSAQAPAVLDALIDYLRAAVPRLDETASTLGQELRLVRAYLELMRMRMPDRLQVAIEADPAADGLRCPPMTLLTLVENAVRHGIDPAEQGGRIEVGVVLRDGRCLLRVSDTGVGLHGAGEAGLGTGLATLRERLQLAFGGDARLSLAGRQPHGVVAEVEFPAQPASAP